MVLEKCEEKHHEITHYRPHTRFATEKKQEMRVSKCPPVSQCLQGLFSNIEKSGRGFSTLSGRLPFYYKYLTPSPLPEMKFINNIIYQYTQFQRINTMS